MTAPLATRPITVLLVEDNPGDADLILEMLRDLPTEEFDLEQVDRLESALARLRHAAVDVVLLDLGLPDSSGLETFRRAHRQAPEEPIVVISGLDDEQMAVDAVRAGAQDYLVKGRIEGALLARVIRYAIERKRTEHHLRASEERLRAIVGAALDAHVTMDESGVVTGWNPQAEIIFGWPVAEALGRRLADLIIPPAYREAHRAGLTRYLMTGEEHILNRRLELTALRRDGREFPVELTVTALRVGTAPVFSAFIRDITERQRATRDLADTAARLQALMDNANDGISVLSGEGVVLEVNRRMAETIGRPVDQIGGHHIEEFLSLENRTIKGPEIRQAVAGGGGHVLGVEIRRPDDSVAIVDFSISTVDLAGERVVLTIGRDVTQQRQLEQQFMQAQRLESVGLLAGGVAHDFNNILSAILGNTEILLEDLPPDDSRSQEVAEIRTAAQRAAGLTRQLLAFSRQQVFQSTVLKVNSVVETVEKMLRRVIGEDIDLHTALAPDVGNVRADAGQLEQVLVNLVVNARDAMPTGGQVTIATANAELTEDYVKAHSVVVPGPYVMLAVSDTGVGMSPETQSRIFEPFFTTKGLGKGTGLGLATVYGIVKQSDGYVWVYSEPGHGTTFKIYLPRVDEPAASPVAPRERAAALTGSETILLTEDDEQLRRLVRRGLDKLGYRVLEAANAQEALTQARAYKGRIHLLLTDVVMPGESGRQLALQLSEIRPDVRVLYMSGYADAAIAHRGVLEPGFNYLQKPFTPATLARRVRDVLDAE